ncbi:unnamed protein product, partial [Meganyctiphanes norvegica]
MAAKDKGEVSARDLDRIKFAFDIFDFDGKGQVDTFYIGDLMRALNLNPTNKYLEKFEPAAQKGQKMMKMDEFIPMFSSVKKDKDQGSYEDFVEVLKLYDKQENGTMMVQELEYILKSLGEPLEKADVEEVLKELVPPEDDEGCVEFDPFLRKLCGIKIFP